jgi:hypothetical protein
MIWSLSHLAYKYARRRTCCITWKHVPFTACHILFITPIILLIDHDWDIYIQNCFSCYYSHKFLLCLMLLLAFNAYDKAIEVSYESRLQVLCHTLYAHVWTTKNSRASPKFRGTTPNPEGHLRNPKNTSIVRGPLQNP